MSRRELEDMDPGLDSSFGHLEDVGYWAIDLDVPGSGSIEDFNRQADRATQAFILAFRDLCQVTNAEGDLTVLDEDWTIRQEHGEVELAGTEDGRFRATPESRAPAPSANVLLRRVLLTCEAAILGAEGDDPEMLHIPDGIHFHYSCRDSESDGRLRIEGAYCLVEAGIDPWLDFTRHPRTWDLRDNRALAARNRPRLEAALRRWEESTGRPIAEFSSNPYRRQIGRWGFAGEAS